MYRWIVPSVWASGIRGAGTVLRAGLLAAGLQGPSLAESADPPPPPRLLCAADRPAAHPGEQVTLRAWAIGGAEALAGLQWQWQASFGTVQGDEPAHWRFAPGVLPEAGAIVTAVVQATGTGLTGRPLRCEVELVFTERRAVPDGQPRGDPSVRGFLLSGQQPPPDFGMYSYLLMTKYTTDAERDRQVHAIAELLWLLEPWLAVKGQRATKELNLALIPVTREVALPETVTSRAQARTLAAQVLEAYDYFRARSLLADFCVEPGMRGPYLVALRERDGCDPKNLLMDMSGVVPELAADWINTFQALATAERAWGMDTRHQLLLKVRNVIAKSYRGTALTVEDIARRVRYLEAPR